MRRALAVVAALGAVLALGAPAVAGARERFDTRLLARIPTPGYPALAYVHPNGRIYEGTYVDPEDEGVPSRVLEYEGDGTLRRSYTVPGQNLEADHGVQVATSTGTGDLVVLDRGTVPARGLLLNRNTHEFSTYATFEDLKPCPPGTAANDCSPTTSDEPPVPNYAAWGPDGSLYVTDFLQGVVWRVPPGGGPAVVWLSDRRLDGGMFGTTGIALAADRSTLMVAQGSAGGGGSLLAASGRIFAVPIEPGGGPGPLRQVWESRPGDLPDGFAIAASGRLYIPLVGLPQQIAVVAPDGTEEERFPSTPGSGDNGSEVPFDSPSSARFLGTRLIVANQSAVEGDPEHQAILDVEAGEPGLEEFIPGLDRIPPVISRTSLSRSVFRVVGRGRRPMRRTHRGTFIRLGLSEAARLEVFVARRRGRGYDRIGRIQRHLGAGRHTLAFRGRVRRPDGRLAVLHRGRYRFALRARDAAGNRSQTLFHTFFIER